MSLNKGILRFAVLLGLATGTGACLDSAAGPLEPSRPGATLADGSIQLLESTGETTTTVVESTIGPEGGVLEIAGGHSLHFPVGALLVPTTIRAEVVDGRVGVFFGPHGLVFPDAARPTLTLSYAGAEGITDADAADLLVVYLDAEGQVQEILQTEADTLADVVRTRIGHFSTYVLATD